MTRSASNLTTPTEDEEWRAFPVFVLEAPLATLHKPSLVERMPGEPWKAALPYADAHRLIATVTTIARLPQVELTPTDGVLETSVQDAFVEASTVAGTWALQEKHFDRNAFRSWMERARGSAAWADVSIAVDGDRVKAFGIAIRNISAVVLDAGDRFVVINLFGVNVSDVILASGASLQLVMEQSVDHEEGYDV